MRTLNQFHKGTRWDKKRAFLHFRNYLMIFQSNWSSGWRYYKTFKNHQSVPKIWQTFFVWVLYKILEHYAFLNLGSCSDGHGTIFCIPVRIWTAWMVKSGKCQAKSTITIQPISIGICEIITQNGHNKFSLNIGILTWISIS